jgi:hypothetical protein
MINVKEFAKQNSEKSIRKQEVVTKFANQNISFIQNDL